MLFPDMENRNQIKEKIHDDDITSLQLQVSKINYKYDMLQTTKENLHTVQILTSYEEFFGGPSIEYSDIRSWNSGSVLPQSTKN